MIETEARSFTSSDLKPGAQRISGNLEQFRPNVILNQETFDVKRISRYLPLFVLPLLCLQFANAQSGVDFAIGFGEAFAPAAKTGIDQNLISCTLGSSGCASTPSLKSFTMGFNGDLMLWKHMGIGGEVNFAPAKQDYVLLQEQVVSAGIPSIKLQDRLTLWDFNAILQPVATKRASLKLQGGIGGANIKFYESGTSTTAITGAQNFSQYFGSSNHFQAHLGVGVQIYLKEHLFIRPQFDYHYVRNLSQFGRDGIVRGSVWIGYTFGGA
jgi:hypothetical protein